MSITITITAKMKYVDIYLSWLHLVFGVSFLVTGIMCEITNNSVFNFITGLYVFILYMLSASAIYYYKPILRGAINECKELVK